MNSKNNNVKKDLHLAYSQENMTVYPTTIKGMARYLSTQYPNKNSANQRNGKKGDRNGKKGDDSKSKDKDNNTTGTAGTHVGDTTPSEESTAPSGGASVDAHVSEAYKQSSRQSRTAEEISGANPMSDDDFWGGTNPGDVSIDTANSKEMMTGSHITEYYTHE